MKEETSDTATIGEALKAAGGILIRGEAGTIFRGVSTDSRTLRPGNLFVCLRGDNFDGHHFLAAAAEAGAAGFVVQKDSGTDILNERLKQPVIVVEDTLTALGDIAGSWRRKWEGPVIAITGSAGKTTTKEITAGILRMTKTVLMTEGNLNNRIGLPLTLLRLTSEHEVAVLEMGTNTPGEIACLTRIAEPSIGLITNIGAAHLEKLISLANVRQEKGALFENMQPDGIAVINRDDKAVEALGRRRRNKCVTYALKRDADVSARDVRTGEPDGIAFRIRIGRNERTVRLQVSGEHNLYNALGASAAAFAFGAEPEVICRGLEAFKGVSGRFAIRTLPNGVHMIDDTYNANPLSVTEALKTLVALRGSGNSIVVLGDMLELGEKAGQWHRKIGRCVAESGSKSLLLMGDYSRETAAGAMDKGMKASRIFFYEDPGQVRNHLQASLKAGDWVLVKGSRKMKMERIVRLMTEAYPTERNET